MAKTVRIRAVPEDVHHMLRARAAAAGLSLSDYLLAEIIQVADRSPLADVLARAGARHDGAPTDVIVEVIRAGRDPK